MDNRDARVTEYRNNLLTSLKEQQGNYDKSVITLSGGALGISLTFLKEIGLQKGINQGKFLLFAWVCWGLSISCALFSYYSSALAFRKAVKQTDRGIIYTNKGKMYTKRRGGIFQILTDILNAFSGLLFFVGVILIVLFTYNNIKF
ncbi:MAG: hypothetical protein HKK67_13795 [Chlorobiaceae bacterium]|nr:hypothetical protein [Chlorobiaceae bacterium]